MNTNTTARIRTSLFAVAVVASVATSSPASANHVREDTGRSTVTAFGAYVEPLDALGGDTLAQYVARHHAEDPRIFAGV